MSTDTDWLLAGATRIWAPVATPLGLALALLVTGHILLSKRDVAACIGWIGLAWLAPTWGALIYFLFGINRVVRRARRLRRGLRSRHSGASLPAYDIVPHLAPLERAVREITNRVADARTSVTIFRNGDEGYPAMLAAIDAAQHSVALASYIMRDDAVGRRFVEAFAAAKGRGVEVRVLIDGVGSGYFCPIERRLRQAAIPTGLFMHSMLPWRMPFLNLRSHKKLLVVDGRVGFAGGLNISAANVLADKPAAPVADTHFRFDGAVVAQLMNDFAQDWAFTMGEDLDGPRWFPDLEGTGSAASRAISSGPDGDFEKIQSVILEAIACADVSIKAMTPYFLPNEEIVTALKLAAIRGVKVDIIVPSRSDHRFVDLAMRAHIGPLLEHGVRFWLGPPPFNHSKLLVVDKQWSLVGSANWDMRSLRLNFELGVEIYDEDLAVRLDGIMRERQISRLRLRDLRIRTLPVRLRDAGLRLLLPYI